MSDIFEPICPVDCESSVPDVEFNECAPNVNAGEVTRIYLAAADADDFTDVTSLAEWTPRLTSNNIKELVVIGEFPEPETNELSISDDRKITSNKAFTLQAEIDETNMTNYAFLRKLECSIKMKMWFQTSAGIMYGGNEGIPASVLGNLVIPKDRNDIERFMLKATWRKKHSPGRSISPLT